MDKAAFCKATHYNVSLLSGYDKTSEASGSVKFKIWESMVSYGFDNGVVLSAAYSNVIGEVNDEDGYDKKKVNTAELIASYDVNENFRVWAEATIDCNSDDGAYSYFYAKGSGKLDDDGEEIYEGTNAVMIGARYTF